MHGWPSMLVKLVQAVQGCDKVNVGLDKTSRPNVLSYGDANDVLDLRSKDMHSSSSSEATDNGIGEKCAQGSQPEHSKT